VAEHLMHRAFLAFLKERGKTAILALNQIQFLPKSDLILVIKDSML